MPQLHKVRQPQCFDRFRCLGAACEDTCCTGWGIMVDRETYEKYQNAPSPLIADQVLSDLVEINPARSSAIDYAKFRMADAACPALREGLCSIQLSLGEPWIPDLCSTYPRVLTVVGGALERSFHLSCPEAARLVLNDPDSMIPLERLEEGEAHRAGSVTPISGDSDDGLYPTRTRIVEIIRERPLPLWQRIVSLGFAMDRLVGVDPKDAAAVLDNFLEDLRRGRLRNALAACKSDTAFQLETVLELVVTRMGSDYTAPRFLECYGDFMHGLAWTADSTIEELAARYCLALRSHFLPFMRRHQHLLENYLVNYVFKTVFPYRRKLPNRKFAIDSSGESLSNAFLLLSIHYAIVRTLLVGTAAFYQDKLSVDHVVKLVQSYSKAFLHMTSFEKAAVEYLTNSVADPADRITALVMDP